MQSFNCFLPIVFLFSLVSLIFLPTGYSFSFKKNLFRKVFVQKEFDESVVGVSNVKLKNMVVVTSKVASAFLCSSALISSMYPMSPSIATQSVSMIYKSGKTPIPVTGSQAQASSDSKVGTKKETKFLRCMSTCKSDCQQPGEGLAKTDCVQDCQDQCCSSYEQCSFKIKSTSGNQI